jgi:hypothetical protein
MLRRVALVGTDVSEEFSASFISVTTVGELGTTLAVTSHRRTLRRNTKYFLQLAAPIHRAKCARRRPSRIAFRSLVAVGWIDETASGLIPFIAIFNLGNKKVSRP